MRDFTLPSNNATLRNEYVMSYEQELDETLAMIHTHQTVNPDAEPDPVLVERARDANRIAFELLCAGVIDAEKQQSTSRACAPYLPARAYSRSSLA